ncbi:MAG: hypothetical protein KIT43_13090 [Bauldia sp.]|nr:hypothetical protein [Bauldia sp.]MCW5717045.1 hypothetical protein [Bauldia sp.]
MAWFSIRASAVAIVAGAAFVVPATAQQQPLFNPQTVETAPNDEALRLLGEALGRSVQATQTDPTIPDILEAIDRNIAATQRIRQLAETTPTLTDEQMQQIGREIADIARSFQDIANLAPDVFARRMAEIGTLDGIGEAIGFRIGDTRARIAALEADNQRIQNDLVAGGINEAQVEMRRLTQQANNAEMQALNAAMAAWDVFSERHGEVMTRMGDQTEDLEVFFHALHENARVYAAAAQTLSLANSLRAALADLERIETLDFMRSQMVQSWSDLMRIVGEVNDGLILQPGM